MELPSNIVLRMLMLLQRGLNISALARGRLLYSQNDRRSTTNHLTTDRTVEQQDRRPGYHGTRECHCPNQVIDSPSVVE
jgi:hypothetical protein